MGMHLAKVLYAVFNEKHSIKVTKHRSETF